MDMARRVQSDTEGRLPHHGVDLHHVYGSGARPGESFAGLDGRLPPRPRVDN